MNLYQWVRVDIRKERAIADKAQEGARRDAA